MSFEAFNDMHEANRRRWDASSPLWAQRADNRGIWKKCHKNPELVFSKTVLNWLKDIDGQKVCVLGSGDNQAVFALAGLGARVTSVDISAKQLEVAAGRASELGLKIKFVHSDVTHLKRLEDETFDLIYTGGHVAVWVSNLKKYYAEAVRILKPKGLFIVDEYHPFRRVWKEAQDELIIDKPYYDRGPYKYYLNDDILHQSKGKYESYEFHWTIGDFFNAIIQSGCTILEVDEYGEKVDDWEGAPMQGLPEHLLIVGRKF